MKRAWLLLIIAGCGASTPAVDRGYSGMIEHAVPAGWTKQAHIENRTTITVWTPPDDNPGKESLTIVESPSVPALAKAGAQAIEHVLDEAQRSLPGARFGAPSTFTSSTGLGGARVEGTFVPAGQTAAYQRVHAVVINGSSLIHVMYTARTPDREPLQIVVDSLQRKGV